MMLGVILLILSSMLIVLLVNWYLNVWFYEKYLKGIPGPRGLPLLGNYLKLGSAANFLSVLMEEYLNKYKSNFKAFLGGQAILIITEPEDVEFILNSNIALTKATQYQVLQLFMGNGLTTSRGNSWRKHRKIITPAFHLQVLERFLDVFNAASKSLVSKLKEKSKEGSLDIQPFIKRCTFDIICETGLGISVNAQDDLESEYIKCIDTMIHVAHDVIFSPISNHAFPFFFSRTYRKVLAFLFSFSRTYRKGLAALEVVHGYSRSLVNKRKEEFLISFKNFVETRDSFGEKKKRAFLDLLFEYSINDPSFTDENIQQEVDTFLASGYETTAAAITYTLHALAMNPDVQKQVYAEMKELFSNDWGCSLTHKDLGQMKYLEMVIKESLRMYTIVPLIGRTLEEDIDMNGRLLPKGLQIYIFLYGITHSPKWYENPEKFDPERFNTKNSKTRNPFIYTPFSAGPRNCIGQKFAMFVMKSTITHILRTFEVLPSIPEHQPHLEGLIVLKPVNGVYLRLKERN